MYPVGVVEQGTPGYRQSSLHQPWLHRLPVILLLHADHAGLLTTVEM